MSSNANVNKLSLSTNVCGIQTMFSINRVHPALSLTLKSIDRISLCISKRLTTCFANPLSERRSSETKLDLFDLCLTSGRLTWPSARARPFVTGYDNFYRVHDNYKKGQLYPQIFRGSLSALLQFEFCPMTTFLKELIPPIQGTPGVR